MASASAFTALPGVADNLPLRVPRDFLPVTMVTNTPNVLVVNPDRVTARDIRGFVELARSQPGKVSWGSSTIGSPDHLAGELFQMQAGVKMNHVPYKGNAPAVNDLIAGHIPVMCNNLGGTLPYMGSGQIRILAQTGRTRSAAAPDVPTERYKELGQRYRHHYAQHMHDISLFDGVLPMLQDLRERHHWLTVATGKSRRGLDEALHSAELQGVFDGSRTVDETAGKPHPLMLHELMREFGADPERTLMVGDTTHDLEMAMQAATSTATVLLMG